MLTMFLKVPLHILKYKSHTNLEINMDPTTYAHYLLLSYDKWGLKNNIL